MNCPKCSFENPPEAKFCGKCGSPLAGAVPPAPAVVSPEMKIGIAIASVFVPLLGIIMGAIYMNAPQPEKKAAGKLWLLVALGVTVAWCLCGLIYGMLGAQTGAPYGQ